MKFNCILPLDKSPIQKNICLGKIPIESVITGSDQSGRWKDFAQHLVTAEFGLNFKMTGKIFRKIYSIFDKILSQASIFIYSCIHSLVDKSTPKRML